MKMHSMCISSGILSPPPSRWSTGHTKINFPELHKELRAVSLSLTSVMIYVGTKTRFRQVCVLSSKLWSEVLWEPKETTCDTVTTTCCLGSGFERVTQDQQPQYHLGAYSKHRILATTKNYYTGLSIRPQVIHTQLIIHSQLRWWALTLKMCWERHKGKLKKNSENSE